MSSLIAPFLPLELRRRGIEDVWMGRIIASFSLSFMLFSPVVGCMLAKCSRRCLVSFALILMGISSTGIGCTGVFITSNKQFIAVMIACRVVEGLGTAMIFNSMMSIVAGNYSTPTHRDTMISYNEMTMALGVMIGPAVSSQLYDLGRDADGTN